MLLDVPAQRRQVQVHLLLVVLLFLALPRHLRAQAEAGKLATGAGHLVLIKMLLF